MQLIGTDQVLGLLGDRAVLVGGEKLGRHWRVNHVKQNALLHLVAAGLGNVTYQVADQGLGHRPVHAVHGHVVTVVGGPTQCQLREVAGADHHAALQPPGWRHP